MSQNTKQKASNDEQKCVTTRIYNFKRCLLSVQIRLLHKINFIAIFTQKSKEKENLGIWTLKALKFPWKISDLYWFKIDILIYL